MSGFTPGPWTVFGDKHHDWPGIESEPEAGKQFSVVVFGDEWDTAAADSGVQGRTREEAIANAHLIAAAPELLEAAKVAADILECSARSPARERCLLELNAAIAKAEGPA